jgi:hypothetical protein
LSLALREDQRLRVFKNRVLRKTFGSKIDAVRGNRGDCIMRSFVICAAHKI